MLKVLLCVVAVAFLQIEGRQRATADNGNFLDDKQWLTTVSQYDKEPGHWNKFRDDDYFRNWNTGRHTDQGLDAAKDPCLNVKCSRHKVCITQDNHRVICISHRRLTHSMKATNMAHKQRKGSNCKPCPVVQPHPVCGTDGHVYSSLCKLEYQACVSGKQISVKCEGQCPCSTDKLTIEGKNEPKAECGEREFREVVSRLKDWFKVLHENGNHNKKTRAFQRQDKDRVRFDTSILPICKDSLGWMFNRLDTNYDLLLDQSELGSIYFDNHDLCMKPFFNSCDTYRDGRISNNEWCYCFQRHQDPPCLTQLTNIQRQHGGKKPLGIFLPTCDEDGYYKATQCHSSVGQCWCVDRYGNELGGSRSNGHSDCEGEQESSGDFGSADFHEWSDDEDDEEDVIDEEVDAVDNEDDEDDDDEYDAGGDIW
ncbi:testican-3 isoform X1 [Pristis pectinata]|uniref:testican-3 isoform X1 n=1 Tax=Pristis pectinata TaxID=685728 RepID=UPI00223E80B8|nr:testican-3 isoform X1 [Pristis pectinata]XP_051893629.1 testican-3 isoform X1 [Pristis pectinata]XP_051893639.1 testican-3 isoform X1 [Pristis pectinata]